MADDETRSIWERCKKCAAQMTGGPRCFEHNPTPEMREERRLAGETLPTIGPKAPGRAPTRRRKKA